MILGSTIYNWGLLWTYHSQLLNGLLVALEVAVTGLVLSVFGGLLLAVWRMAGPPFSLPATLYINIFRGIPALVSVIWVYFGWSLVLGIKLSVYEAAVTALALLYSAYLAEIFRAALTAVPRGQREAGLALGLKRWQVFFRVTIPQAARIALPNIGSMLIGMVKDTSTFMVIGLVEVVYVSESIVSTTFEPFVIYTAAAALYVIVAFAIDFTFRILEQAVGGRATGRMAVLLTARRRKRLTALALGGTAIDGVADPRVGVL